MKNISGIIVVSERKNTDPPNIIQLLNPCLTKKEISQNNTIGSNKLFNGNLTIPFELNDNQVVSLKITNILGQEIKKFNFYSLQAGKHKVTWNGVGINGNPVGSGMYFISLETNSEVSFQKVLYLK